MYVKIIGTLKLSDRPVVFEHRGVIVIIQGLLYYSSVTFYSIICMKGHIYLLIAAKHSAGYIKSFGIFLTLVPNPIFVLQIFLKY